MMVATAYIVGLRIDPQAKLPQWYTLWFEDDAGQNRVASKNGRIQWQHSVENARRLGSAVSGAPQTSMLTLEAVCDAAEALYEIENPSIGNEAMVLLFLNILDDLEATVTTKPRMKGATATDRLAKHLTDGEAMTDALEQSGGRLQS